MMSLVGSYVDVVGVLMFCCSVFFFCKQETAYEMRISDWSSDVCSSDLGDGDAASPRRGLYVRVGDDAGRALWLSQQQRTDHRRGVRGAKQIGRASCRERVCKYV